MSFNRANQKSIASPEPMLEEEENMIQILEAIETMPDKVINSGKETINQWINTNTSTTLQLSRDMETQSIGGTAGCVGAIGTAIVIH